VLRDDTLRYAQGTSDVEAHVWEGLTHVFPSSLGMLEAAEQALDSIGTFLRKHLQD
jgi:epsilon-lactone hydrolase